MNLDQKNYGLFLSADISWRQLMSADRMRSYFLCSKFIFLRKSTSSEKNQLVWATVSWFLRGQLWQSRNLSLDFWWVDAPCQKSVSCPSLIKIGQLIQQLQPKKSKNFKHALSPNLLSVSHQILWMVGICALVLVARISPHSDQRFNRCRLQGEPRPFGKNFGNLWGYLAKMLQTLMPEHPLVPFGGKMGLGWIIEDLGFHPFLLWETFLGHRSPWGRLRKVFGGWFGTPPKVLRMTQGGGPCCKGFGQGGSKRVKTCPTSVSIFIQWGRY